MTRFNSLKKIYIVSYFAFRLLLEKKTNEATTDEAAAAALASSRVCLEAANNEKEIESTASDMEAAAASPPPNEMESESPTQSLDQLNEALIEGHVKEERYVVKATPMTTSSSSSSGSSSSSLQTPTDIAEKQPLAEQDHEELVPEDF